MDNSAAQRDESTTNLKMPKNELAKEIQIPIYGRSLSNSSKLGLPLVSVIVINYNNGKYLQACVQSVLEQTYKNVECIVVDDRSTDNSWDILRLIKKRHKEIKIIRNSEEQYQTICGHCGFCASTGQYVIFLDADDLLLPECIETHIFAHLSSVNAIGFTTCDSLQVAGNQIVRANYGFFSQYLLQQGNSQTNKSAIKLISEYAPNLWPYNSAVSKDLVKNIALVNFDNDNLINHIFPVTATSTNCFRRDAIECFILDAPSSSMKETKGSLDCYLICGVWLFSPSMAINYPLVGRRIHDGSITGSAGVRAELMGFGVSLDKVISEALAKVCIALTERLINNSSEILRVVQPKSYISAVCRLNSFVNIWIENSVFFKHAIGPANLVPDLASQRAVELMIVLGADYDEFQRRLHPNRFNLGLEQISTLRKKKSNTLRSSFHLKYSRVKSWLAKL